MNKLRLATTLSVVPALLLAACQVSVLPSDATDLGAPKPAGSAGAAADAAAASTSPGVDAAGGGSADGGGLEGGSVALDDGDDGGAVSSVVDAGKTGSSDASKAPDVVRPPFTGSTELGKLAAAMAPGTWAQLSVKDQDATLGVGPHSGSMIHYCNTMPWNAFDHVIEILGEDHAYGHERYARYDEITNAFVLVADDVGFGSSTQHGYDHNTLNPHNGDLYQRFIGQDAVGADLPIHGKRKSVGSGTFVDIPDVAGNFYTQIAIGATYWSGAFAGAGAQGALLVFNSGSANGAASDGQIAMFDPLANKWFFNKTGMAPFYGTGSTYHSVAEYSAKKNVAVYGGGNAARSKLWRLASDGSVTAMPDAPAQLAIGIQGGLLVEEPVTGNFLLLSDGQLWELDPSGAGAWTQQTGGRQPPANVGIPGPNVIDGMFATAIPEYGVVVFVKQTSQTGGTFFVYRHA